MMTVLEQFVTEQHNDSNDVTFETDLITLLSDLITLLLSLFVSIAATPPWFVTAMFLDGRAASH